MKIKFQHQLYTALVIGSTAFFYQCGSEAMPSGNIASLKKEKDSLREVKLSVSEKINALEDQIKLMDTSGNHNVPIVSVTPVEVAHFKHYFKVQGLVESDKNADIRADVAAKVLRISVKEGERVKKGQLLMELDGRVLQKNINELKTQIELATTIFNKQKSLWDQNIGSEMQFLEAKTNKESLENRLSSLNAQMDYYNIKSPFDGTVDEVYPKVGEMASPSSPLLRIMDLSKVYIKSDVSENYIGKIKIGDTSLIEIPSLGLKIPSQISRIGNFINPNNRTFKIRFEITNQEAKLIPNMMAEINILDYVSPKKQIIIPTKLLQETPQGEEFVYVLHQNGDPKAQKVMITSGASYQGMVEILEGLTAEHELIVKGARNIKDGEIVEVNNN